MPDTLLAILATIAVVLALAPLLGGHDLGIVKIPKFDVPWNWIAGVAGVATLCVLFVPSLPTMEGADGTEPVGTALQVAASEATGIDTAAPPATRTLYEIDTNEATEITLPDGMTLKATLESVNPYVKPNQIRITFDGIGFLNVRSDTPQPIGRSVLGCVLSLRDFTTIPETARVEVTCEPETAPS